VKIVKCRLCNDYLIEVSYNATRCTCGNVVAQYWKDGAKFTLAVKKGPSSVSVVGYNTVWADFLKYERVLEYNAPIRAFLTWPWRKLFKLWIWSQINGRVVWIKPLSQAFCHTKIGSVDFYTYD